jgi:hypothetical protein
LEFPELLQRIEHLFRSKYPPHILATLGSYGSMAGVSNRGTTGTSLIRDLQQHHFELLQALSLTLPLNHRGIELPTPADIQSVLETVTALADAFHQRRTLAAQETDELQERTALALREKLRMHTQIVRNWGYFSSVIRISSELYEPLDKGLYNYHGFTSGDLIRVGRTLINIFEARFNNRLRVLRNIFKVNSIRRLVRQYYKHYPYVEGDPEAFLRNIPSSATLQMVRSRLLAHADLALVPLVCVTGREVAHRAAISPELTSVILNALSLEPGDLADLNREHLFLNNPVWTAPIIKIQTEYFCAAPQVIFSHIQKIMNSLVEAAGLQPRLQDRRARYLERKIQELLRTALPNSVQWQNAKWSYAASQYESDLVAKLDRTIVIVEAKSATLTEPGLRGAADRVKRHVQELILEPSLQSARLEEIIWKAGDSHDKALAALSSFGEGFSEADQIVRVTVTLDDFSILSSSERELKTAGWIPENEQLACTLNIADFESVIDILGDPARIVHYFMERQRIQKLIDIFADEMDFLGFYLETAFNVWELESQEFALYIVGMSLSIDRYYESGDAGVSLPRPKPKIRPYFKKLIKRVQARRALGWLSITVDILRACNYDEQRRVEDALEKLKKNVELNWRKDGHECSLIVSPPPAREAGIVFFLYPPELAGKRKEIAQQLSAQALGVTGRSRCVLVGRNTARWAEAYSFLGVARPSEELRETSDD